MTTTLTYHISGALDRASLGDLYEHSRPFELIRARAVAYACSILHDDEAAEDAVQQAYVVAYERRDRLEDLTGFESWLMECVRRCSKHTASRRRYVLSEQEESEEADARDFELLILNKLEAEAVRNAIAGLPETHRLPVILHHIEGLPLAEIAAQLTITVGAVKMRLSHARASLRHQLRPWEFTYDFRRPEIAKPIEYATSYILNRNPHAALQQVTTTVYDIMAPERLSSISLNTTPTYTNSPDSRTPTMIA